jgi:hypothetical protein
METVPAWLAIAGGVAGFVVALATLATFGRTAISWTIREVIHEPDGAVVDALDRLTKVETKLYNGLTEEVNRTGARVDEIRLSVARIEGALAIREDSNHGRRKA